MKKNKCLVTHETSKGYSSVSHTFEVNLDEVRFEEIVQDDITEDFENSKGIFGSPTYQQAYKKIGESKYIMKYATCPLCGIEINIAKIYNR